jgi:prepilin-type N-terminal cleavage/methylation domain-containing protein
MTRMRSEGYTLIELMITVLIVGILSAIAIPVFSSYLQKSRAQEAIEFLGIIKLRQEAYRSEFGEYCNVSHPWPMNGANPLSGSDALPWGNSPTKWLLLGAHPDGAVRFSFNTIAGAPTVSPPSTSWVTDPGGAPAWANWGLTTSPNDFWYVAEANGDLDEDGTRVVFGTASGMKRIWCSQAKGWE